jgi:hypothetical protein
VSIRTIIYVARRLVDYNGIPSFVLGMLINSQFSETMAAIYALRQVGLRSV